MGVVARWTVVAHRTWSFGSDFSQSYNENSKVFNHPLLIKDNKKTFISCENNLLQHIPLTSIRKQEFSEVQPQTKNILADRKVNSELYACRKRGLPIKMLNHNFGNLSCGSSSAINLCKLSWAISFLLLLFPAWQRKSLFVSRKGRLNLNYQSDLKQTYCTDRLGEPLRRSSCLRAQPLAAGQYQGPVCLAIFFPWGADYI